MSYSICGFIIPQGEEFVCSERGFPFVTLAGGLSLMPLERDYLFLTEGDETNAKEDFEFTMPPWFSEIASCFSKSAYIEAEFWGGTGMQAAVVLERGKVIFGPEISPGAINSALRQTGANEAHVAVFGVSVTMGKDPFDLVGLGRHRSVSGWLRESVATKRSGNS